jgi:SPP1 family predicted phage head-tail adaptor
VLSHKQNIGALDYRITFQQKIVGENESNEDEETGWENIATNPTVWASKDDRSGNEVYQADKLTDYETVVFVCRYRNDVTPKNRLVCEGIAYDIISINELSRKRYLKIVAETGREFVGEIITEDVGAFSSAFSNGFNT